MSDIPIEIILLSCQGPITADGAANKKRRQAKIEIMQIHCQQTTKMCLIDKVDLDLDYS